jgi:hypothetical protein
VARPTATLSAGRLGSAASIRVTAVPKRRPFSVNRSPAIWSSPLVVASSRTRSATVHRSGRTSETHRAAPTQPSLGQRPGERPEARPGRRSSRQGSAFTSHPSQACRDVSPRLGHGSGHALQMSSPLPTSWSTALGRTALPAGPCPPGTPPSHAEAAPVQALKAAFGAAPYRPTLLEGRLVGHRDGSACEEVAPARRDDSQGRPSLRKSGVPGQVFGLSVDIWIARGVMCLVSRSAERCGCGATV